jgi:hypothetical protein
VALDHEAPELDQAVWAMTCGTHHANWFALADGLKDRIVRNDPLDPHGGVAALTVEGAQLAMFAVVLFHGADAVVRARTELMGWDPPSEMTKSREAMAETSRLVVEQLKHPDSRSV